MDNYILYLKLYSVYIKSSQRYGQSYCYLDLHGSFKAVAIWSIGHCKTEMAM